MNDRRHLHRRQQHDRRAGLATDMQVGDSITLEVLHGTGRLLFTLDSKTTGELPDGVAFDAETIQLTISRKPGQLARVQLQARETVRIVLPTKKVAA
jgi:hypothetical protein